MKNRILSLLLALSMVLPGTLSAVSLLSPAPARAAEGATTHYKFTPSNSAVTDHTKLNTNLSWGTDSLRTKAIANASFTMYLPTGPVNGRYFRMYNSAGTDSTEEHSVKMTQDEYHYGLDYRAWGFDYETKVKDEQGNETTVKKTAYYKAATESLEITLQNFSPLDTTGIKAANLSMMVLESTVSSGVSFRLDRRLEVKVSLDGTTWLDGSAGVRSAALVAGNASNLQLFRIETDNLLDIPGVAGNTIRGIKLLPDGEDVSSRGNIYFTDLAVNTYKTAADFDRLVPAEEITYTSVPGDTLRQIAVEEGVRTASVEWKSDADINIYSPAGSSTGAATASLKSYSKNTTYRGPVYERTSDSSRELFQSLLAGDNKYTAAEAKTVTATMTYDKVYTSEHPYGMDCQTFVFNAISRVSRTNAWAVAYTPHATRATLLDGLTPLTHPIYTDHDIIEPTKAAKGDTAIYQHYAKAKAGDIAISYLSNQNNSVHTRLVTEVKVVEKNGAIDPTQSYMRFTEQTGSDVYAYTSFLSSTIKYSTSKPSGWSTIRYQSHSRTGQESTYSFSKLLETGYVVYTLDEYQTGQVEDVKVQAVAGSKTADTDFANGGLNLAVCSNYRIIKRHVTLKVADTGEVLFDSRTDDPNFDEYYNHYFPVGFNYQNDDLDLMLKNLPNGDYTITASVDSGPFTSLSQTTVPTNTVDINFTVNRDNICDTDNDGINHESGLGWTELNEAWFSGRTQANNGAYNLPAGKYYLAKDLTVPNNGALSLAANAVLCLNGYDLKLLPSGTNNSILVNNKAHLTLCDCAGTGTIQAGDAQTCPGSDGNGLYALYVAVGGQVDMYGGTITNTYARFGSVYIGTTSETTGNAVMNLYGGAISGNHAPKHFGGISLNYGGIFNMYGGTISDNSGPASSSGIYVVNTSEANIYDGTISGCNSPSTILISNGTLNMNGGSIIGNTCTTYDAVYVAAGTFNMSGGLIADNIVPSGRSQVGCASGAGTFVQTGGTVIARSSTDSGICGPDLTWTLYGNGELSFEGTGAMYDWNNPAEVPWYSNRESISQVIIPSGVTNIGAYAFAGYTSLTQATIAGSVESIGAYAFYECTGLSEITIPDSVTAIGSHAFYNCTKLAKAAMGSGVLCIGSYAFFGCKNLTAVTIPNNVETIGSYAFGNCTGMTAVTIPNRVSTIGDNAFANCTGLTSATIGSGVTTAGSSLFSGCTALTTVTFAPGLTRIWDNAFTAHTALTTVSIPGSVTTIGASAFADCTGLTAAAIPNGVTNIGDYAFSGCSSLPSVTIPASVSAIGYHAFSDCTGANALTIENGVTDIGHYAFSNCTNLTTVTIPDSVLCVGNSAFTGCEALSAVNLGAGVTSIGQGAFSDCNNLRSFTVASGNTAYSSANGVLFNKAQTALIRYAGTGGAYTVPNGVTDIRPEAFSGRTDLTEVEIPGTIVTIGTSAFYGCTNLNLVSFQGNAPSEMGASAFANCDNGLTLYCLGRADGWTNSEHYDAAAGTWYGYPLTVIAVYSVGVTDAANGTIRVDTTEGEAGTTVTITATPNEGYYCKSILLDGAILSGNTFQISGDHNVSAIFAKITTFYGANLVLGDTLDMNFFHVMSSVTDPNSYAKIVRSYADGRADDVRIIPKSQWNTSGSYYKITYDGLAAKEMCDNINITLYNSDDVAISYTWTDNIRTYVMRMVDRPDQQKARTLYIDMLNYGAAAQQTFTYATNNLANALLTDAHQADATQTADCENQRVMTDNVQGSSLELTSKIVLNFYFTGITKGMYAQISYTDYLGNTVSYRTEYEDFVKNNGSYKLSVDKLAVADGSTLVTCTVYKADGTQYASVTDSMTSYLARFVTSYPWFEQVVKFITSTHDYMLNK